MVLRYRTRIDGAGNVAGKLTSHQHVLGGHPPSAMPLARGFWQPRNGDSPGWLDGLHVRSGALTFHPCPVAFSWLAALIARLAPSPVRIRQEGLTCLDGFGRV